MVKTYFSQQDCWFIMTLETAVPWNEEY